MIQTAANRLTLAFLLVLAVSVAADAEDRVGEPGLMALRPDQPIMPMDEVRIGMKGYGLSVFQGTRIEPFAVEVISVIPDSSPKRGTVWVRCPDERMQLSGPVQGMSGSPIFLWDENENAPLGEGGRLIGAFAFGYGLSKDCIVGVQPIELMRDIATRRDDPARAAQAGSWHNAERVMSQLVDLGEKRGEPEAWTWRAKMLREVVRRHESGSPVEADADRGGSIARGPRPLMLPLSVGPQELADAVAPMFAPMGFAAVAGETLAGKPPVGIDTQIKLEPGSALVVPLVYGDMDLSAAGTVTDVLADGTVLAFGHAMFGEGATALPMATGYVHFILPSIDTSFKRSGSLRMAGSLVRDEESGILGIDEVRYTTAPIEVTVEHVDGQVETYHYEMAHYRPLAPQIAAIVVLRSVMARQGVPVECTIDMDAEMTFEGGYSFAFSSRLAGADIVAPLQELLPVLTLMSENPFESCKVTSMKTRVKVSPGVDAASIAKAGIDHAEVAPGGTVRVTLELQPQDKPPFTVTGSITVPHDMPEGEYPLIIGGGSTYASMLNKTNPHRGQVNSIDDLAALIRDAYAISNEGIYLMLARDDGGLALGRTELPQVPSSRVALLTSPTHNFATPYGRLAVERIDTTLTLLSQINFQISVRKGAYGSSPQ